MVAPTMPVSRRSIRSNCAACGTYALSVACAILNRPLRRVIERQRRAIARVGRFRVDTVKLRNPVPAARDREAALALEHADVAPVAPADIVGGDLEKLSRRRPHVFVAGIGEQHAVPQVPIPLPPRRIAFHAAEAAADLKLAPGRFEQAAGVVERCGCGGCRGWSPVSRVQVRRCRSPAADRRPPPTAAAPMTG